MPETRVDAEVARPARCPFCNGKIIDTQAKVISEKALWRCRECEATWTIESQARSKRLPR
jgi:ribosomal protein L37AE/L43A